MRRVIAVAALALGASAVGAHPGSAQQDPEATWPVWYEGAQALPPGVHAIEKDSTYAVSGASAAAIQQQMDEHAPMVDGRRVQGAHFWEWWHHYEYQTVGDGMCQVTDSVVLVRSLIVLPDWSDSDLAHRDLVRSWNGFRFRLREHEDGHRAITLASATELWEAVGARAPSLCTTLRGDIRGLASSIFDASAERQSAYDEDTAHGLRQGARWPPG